MKQHETLETNIRQAEFYDNKKKNFVTKIWFSIRNGMLNNLRRRVGIESQIHKLHLSWLGDLANKKILDLGCYAGNPLSIYLAVNSKEYVAIDLSEKGIAHLRNRIKDIPHASALAIDFLSEEFKDKDFDLIYAYGVLHHFKDLEMLINRLNEKLSPNGIIISNDPLQTSLPIKIIRTIYRPFQTDKDWEWPFTKKVYYQFEKAFEIKERRAMLGKAKWFVMVNFLPISVAKKAEIAAKWHRADWDKSAVDDDYMFSCMHLTMLMQKKD
ncbi:MAG: methyltransferase domain-containing protein [Gillisia sp.]